MHIHFKYILIFDETYLGLMHDVPSFSESIEIFKNISVETGTRFVDFQDLNFSFTLDKFLNQDHITPLASSDFAKLVKSACFD